MRKNRITKRAAYSVILFSMLFNCIPAEAASKKKKEVIKEDSEVAEKKDKRYDKLFSGKKKTTGKGLITIILCNKDIYLEIPDEVLDREMIMGTTVVSSSSPRETWEGLKPAPYKSVSFSRSDTLMHLGINNKKYFNSSAEKGSKYEKESRNAIFASFPIIAVNPKDSSYVIKATSLFNGDKDYLTLKDEYAYNNMKGFVVRTYNYNSSAEIIKSIEADSLSFSVLSERSYKVTRKLFTMSELAKDEPVTAKVKTSFVFAQSGESTYNTFCVPKGIGVRRVSVLDYSDAYQGTKVKYLAGRWARKEAKPVISFVMDSDFPELWKTAIRKGADIWNQGFAEAGVDCCAISVEERNDNNDVTGLLTNRIRYVVSPSENILSNVWYHPDTGEIFNADISVNHNIINEIQRDAFLSLSPYMEEARSLTPDSVLFVNMLAQKIAFHIGRCLGFEANYKASSVVPADSLSSASYTARNGIMASVMDPAGFNYVAGKEGIISGAKLWQDKAGEIDIYSIRYLYGNDSDNTPVYNSCSYITGSPAIEAGYKFGRKNLVREIMDPYALNNDLGDDQIKSSEKGLKTLEMVVAQASGWLDDQDKDYEYRSSLYDIIIDRYFQYISNVNAAIGGMDKDELNGSCSIVEYNKQKEAVRWSLGKIKEADKFENKKLMSESELNVGIADYITEESFRNLMQKVLSAEEYRMDMLKEIDRYVWTTYPQSGNISNRELRSIKMQNLYIGMLMKELGLDKGEIKEVWNGSDDYQLFALLKECRNRIRSITGTGTQAQRDNAKYLLKRLNDRL